MCVDSGHCCHASFSSSWHVKGCSWGKGNSLVQRPKLPFAILAGGSTAWSYGASAGYTNLEHLASLVEPNVSLSFGPSLETGDGLRNFRRDSQWNLPALGKLHRRQPALRPLVAVFSRIQARLPKKKELNANLAVFTVPASQFTAPTAHVTVPAVFHGSAHVCGSWNHRRVTKSSWFPNQAFINKHQE